MTNSKVVMITGVSSGIGRVAAEKFATQECRVFGSVRSISKDAPIPDACAPCVSHQERPMLRPS